ncbi:MAG: hypothetical protein WC773_02195 [Patescibacteria group bacterium]|jgi:hypothetical protein
MEKYELWFRLAYRDIILTKKMTAAVRPGDRRAPNNKGTSIGENVIIRVMKLPGNEAENINPIFTDDNIPAKITAIEVKRLQDVTPADLIGCSADCSDWHGVANQLSLIYNQVFTGPEEVSIVRFEYT